MRLHIVAVGDRMPGWIDEGVQEYAKRIRGRLSLDVIEISAGKRGRGAGTSKITTEEGQRLLERVPGDAITIALERTGKSVSTEQLAKKLSAWMQDGNEIAFLIGGPEGLSQDCLEQANECWSLSAMTLAHPIARLVLTEQLYRAYSILEGLPYHR